MDPILLLAVGTVIGLAAGLGAATLIAQRRHRSREVAVLAELQAARLRAERFAGDAQAARALLVTTEVLAARTPELERALDAARADAEWNAAHVQALEAEVVALRDGRQRRRASDAGAVGAARTGPAVTVPTSDIGPAVRSRTGGAVPAVRTAGASATLAVAPAALPDPVNASRARAAVPARAATASTAVATSAAAVATGAAATGAAGAGWSVSRPSAASTAGGAATAGTAVETLPDPPWMAEAATLAAAADAQVAPNGASGPPGGTRQTRARAATTMAAPVAPARPAADPDPSFPEAPAPTKARPRSRAASAPAPLPSEAAQPVAPAAAVGSAPPDAAAPLDPAIIPPTPEPAPTPSKPPKPHPHGWAPVRPGLSDPWKWLGRMSPAGIPYAQDDLEAIHGIGPYLARRLREEGVLTWRQVTEWDEEDMALVSRRIGSFPDRIRREDWGTSARALHQARYREALP